MAGVVVVFHIQKRKGAVYNGLKVARDCFENIKTLKQNIDMKKITVKTIWLAAAFTAVYAVSYGQAAGSQGAPVRTHASQPDDEALKNANNPLASIKTVNLHNYFSPYLYQAPDATTNTLWFRYAQPLGRFILRASLPIMTVSSPDASTKSGLYDMNVFLIYKFKLKSEGLEVGLGPALTFPTGTNGLGSGKWQAGVAAIAFWKSNPVVQVGTLLTWQMSYAGDSDKPKTNMFTPQIFGMWQLGGGTYLRSTGAWMFDFVGGTYNVPVGLGIGKVIKTGKTVFNIFMEPQYSVFSYGIGQPKLQVFIGFNTQF